MQVGRKDALLVELRLKVEDHGWEKLVGKATLCRDS